MNDRTREDCITRKNPSRYCARVLVAVLVVIAVVGASPANAASPDKELIQTILKSSSRADRDDAARELADLLDPKPIRTLARKAESNKRAAAALELIEGQLIDVATKTRKVTTKTRVRATKTLAAIDLEETAEALVGLAIDDSKRKVRNAAAASLGKLDESAPLVVDTLLEESTGSFGDDRRQAAIERAVASIGVGAIAPLGNALPTADVDTQTLVIDLLKAIEKKDEDAVAAAWPGIVETLIAKLASPDGFAAAGLLAEIGSPAVPRLIEVARPRVVVDDPRVDPRANAEFALIEMAATDLALVAPLDQALDDRDLALVADLMNFYIQLGKPGSEEVLIAALNAMSDADRAGEIALQFLESGHPPLEAAGRDWAASHGFTVTGQPSGQVLWGNLGGDPAT
ncbi:MAG: HEAT repeat domain-containing protein [Acidimicrobiia bacterium]